VIVAINFAVSERLNVGDAVVPWAPAHLLLSTPFAVRWHARVVPNSKVAPLATLEAVLAQNNTSASDILHPHRRDVVILEVPPSDKASAPGECPFPSLVISMLVDGGLTVSDVLHLGQVVILWAALDSLDPAVAPSFDFAMSSLCRVAVLAQYSALATAINDDQR